MLCDVCGKNPANIRVVSVVAGEKIERNLCAACAAKQNLAVPSAGVGRLLSALLGGAGKPAETANLTCGACGTKFGKLLRTKRVGCAVCYESFRAQISELLKKHYGADTHIGLTPEAQDAEGEDLLEKLAQELEMAIACENFERAAVLRDEIRAQHAAQEGGEANG